MFSALIIDADGKTPATLKSILAPYGFEFTVTENGPEAVNVARQAAPDIILLRAELPLTTGFSVCNRLRRNDDTRKIPLVLYSSNASDEVIEQHRNLKTHADHYLRLPVDGERLLAALRPFLNLPEPRAASGSPPSRPEPRAKPRLDVELSEASGARLPPGAPGHPQHAPGNPQQQFEREFADEFGNLAEQLRVEEEDVPAAPAPAPTPARRMDTRPPTGRGIVVDDSDARRQSGPEAAADDGSGFRAQREVLQLKSQLNSKNREILGLKDELEARERAVLDAKKHHRELQSQLGELETQLVASQELVLSGREEVESALRDKQTVLKREEGFKSRLEIAQKRLKETEQQLSQAQTEAQERLAAIAELEAERDGLAGRVQALSDQLAQTQDELGAAREEVARLSTLLGQAQQDLADGLAAAREDKAAALASLGAQHQAEIDEREQETRITIDGLNKELADLGEQAQQERERMSQMLLETEENARLQIAQLTQNLASTEESARTEINRVTQNLVTAESNARAEIQRLRQDAEALSDQAQADAEDAARKIGELEATLDELSTSLDRAEASLHKRREAALHAQQALAVALKVLDSAHNDGDAS